MGWQCKVCGRVNSILTGVCRDCGGGKDGTIKDPYRYKELRQGVEKITEVRNNFNRYPALKTIAAVYQVLAWLVAGVAIMGCFGGVMLIYSYGSYGNYSGVYIFLSSLIGGAIGFVTLLALSEGIKVAMDIEENTRESAQRT